MNEISYVIVQAGGKGTRMKQLTRNKPKALVPIQNLPMLFHLFRACPDKKFIVIGDYKYDVLKRYLATFADVDYRLVEGTGHTGTCAGLQEALELIPDNTPFMLIWSDLVLPVGFEFPKTEGNFLGVSKDFRCRWSYMNGELVETPSETQGVAGCFIFRSRDIFQDIPENGEFVRYLKGKGIVFQELPLYGTHEYGLAEEYAQLAQCRCRPFNRITVKQDTIIKEGIDDQGRELAQAERAWYQRVEGAAFRSIPKIYSYEPLEMERIHGKNIYEYTNISKTQKNKILESIIRCLKDVHALEDAAADFESCEDAYLDKTIRRTEKIRGLVPFADEPVITINGRSCRNIFFHWDALRSAMRKYYPKRFQLLHGDCTFSNLMLRDADFSPVLIDPRGYFGTTPFLGDTAYEWAKLYYSIVGNYDQFNLKRFELEINEHEILLRIASNGWEDMEERFFELLKDEISERQIKLIHAIIWLSLTTYAWEDYDSICGAFYNGLYYLEEVL